MLVGFGIVWEETPLEEEKKMFTCEAIEMGLLKGGEVGGTSVQPFRPGISRQAIGRGGTQLEGGKGLPHRTDKAGHWAGCPFPMFQAWFNVPVNISSAGWSGRD